MKNVTDKLRLTLVISLSEILFGGFSMFSNARNYYKTYILLTSIVLSVTQKSYIDCIYFYEINIKSKIIKLQNVLC